MFKKGFYCNIGHGNPPIIYWFKALTQSALPYFAPWLGQKYGKEGKNSLYVTRTGYSAVSDAEWVCLSGCTTDDEVFDQTIPYAASQFCDASYGDCTVTLGVNWTPNTYNINLNNYVINYFI